MSNGNKHEEEKKLTPLQENLKHEVERLKRKGIHNAPLEEIATIFDVSPGKIEDALKKLKDSYDIKFKLTEAQTISKRFKYKMEQDPVKHKHLIIDPRTYNHSFFPFGATGDTHIASPHSMNNTRSGPLWDFYKRCADEGIEYVLHGGNWIDGNARFNVNEVLKTGVTAQVEMFIDNYPQMPGVKTVFIAGDDHEGWFWQHKGVDMAEDAALKAVQAGRDDMHFIGYVEADILLIPKKGIFYNRYHASPEDKRTIAVPSLDRDGNAIITQDGKEIMRTSDYSIIRLMHGGGGTAYAKSIRPQTIVNTLEDRDKAQIFIIGHYHKTTSDYIRNAFVYQVGTMEHQSTFMRKKTIAADMGNWLLGAHQDATGAVVSMNEEWVPYVARRPNFHLRNYTINDGK